MVRKITSVIAGYISIVAFIFITFTILYLILGTEGSFKPESYQVSTIWLVITFILGIIAALVGGYISAAILNPFIGLIGVWSGSRIWKQRIKLKNFNCHKTVIKLSSKSGFLARF